MMDILMDPISAGQAMLAAFLAIVFLQSAVDKIVDWGGNLSWLQGHFAKTPLGGMVPILLGTVTIVELLTGVSAIIGLVQLLLGGDDVMIYRAILLSLLSYLMLIFGQRIAKDYDGAKTIAIYFGISLVGLLLFN